MKTRSEARRIRRMRTLGGSLLLVVLLGLEAWFAWSVAKDWPCPATPGSLQGPRVDLGTVFGTR